MALSCSTSVRVTNSTLPAPHIFYGSRDRIKVISSVNQNSKRRQCIRIVPSPVPLHSSSTTKRSFVSQRGFVRSAHTGDGLGGEDHTAMGAVHKLYTAIKNRDLQELSEVIGEECRMVLNFLSLTHVFYGKEQVLEFFSSLMSFMGKRINFVIYPTSHSGPQVGVTWHLDWKKSFMPFGKGYGFYTTHQYNGKLIIGDMGILIEPFKYFGPLQSKLVESFMPLVDKLSLKSKSKKQKALTYGFLSLMIFTMSCLLVEKLVP